MTYEAEVEMIPVKGTFKGERADQVLNTHYNDRSSTSLFLNQTLIQQRETFRYRTCKFKANEAFVYDSLYIETLDFGPFFTQEIQLYSLLEMNRKS